MALGGNLEILSELLGSSEGTFLEYFLIEKELFAISNRKKYVKSMFQVDNMQNVSLQVKF